MRVKVARENSQENVARKHLQKQTSSATLTPRPHGMTGLLLNLQHTHGNRFVQRMLNETIIQRKCDCGGTCDHCQSESTHQDQDVIQDILQRKDSGQPLEPGVQASMESRFGEDFSGVRVHTDTYAVQTSQQLNAVAYTVGRDIFFGAGQYHPPTQKGKYLLAHELTHVLQQGSGTVQGKAEIGQPGDIYEQEADRTANMVLSVPDHLTSGFTPVQKLIKRVRIQRTVAAANIDCNPPAAADIPVVGANPLGSLRAADRQAIELLTNARDDLERGRDRILAGEQVAWPTISDHTAEGLRRIFRMNPNDTAIWTGTGAETVHILIRRLEIVRNLLQSGTIQYHCRSGAGACGFGCGGPCCTAGDFAAACDGIFHNFLCDPYWGQGAAGRTYTVMHEPFHMSFAFIGDTGRWENAHCYSRLAFWLNGRDAPADRRGRCRLAL